MDEKSKDCRRVWLGDVLRFELALVKEHANMRLQDKVRLTVPPGLGWGDKGTGDGDHTEEGEAGLDKKLILKLGHSTFGGNL